jgi:hypothetical protein
MCIRLFITSPPLQHTNEQHIHPPPPKKHENHVKPRGRVSHVKATVIYIRTNAHTTHKTHTHTKPHTHINIHTYLHTNTHTQNHKHIDTNTQFTGAGLVREGDGDARARFGSTRSGRRAGMYCNQ